MSLPGFYAFMTCLNNTERRAVSLQQQSFLCFSCAQYTL